MRSIAAGALLAFLACVALPAQSEAAQLLGLGSKCMDVEGGSRANLTRIILYDCQGTQNQDWQRDGGLIRSAQSGKCLDAEGGGDADNTPIVLYACQGTPNQLSRYSHGQLVGSSGKSIDVKAQDDTNATPLNLYHCTGNRNQNWRIVWGSYRAPGR